MADKHPYVPGPGGLVQVVKHFRNSFPSAVTADTLRKLGFAPKNESYVLNVLRFLGLVDPVEGKRTKAAEKVFNLHDDESFHKEFSTLVRDAYSELFNLHSENAWALDQNSLINFFRSSDQSTAIVGQRQAATFKLLAAFSGYGDVPEAKGSTKGKKEIKKPKNISEKANGNSVSTEKQNDLNISQTLKQDKAC